MKRLGRKAKHRSGKKGRGKGVVATEMMNPMGAMGGRKKGRGRRR